MFNLHRILWAVFMAVIMFQPGSVWALCQAKGDPDCIRPFETYRGSIDFFATGASFTLNEDDDDRPDRLVDEATVVVPVREIPPRAELVRAFLYFGGSLYQDNDGIETPDMTVEIQVPGALSFVSVTGDTTYRSGVIPGFPTVSLYAVRADITEMMQAVGGAMVGTYRVRGFDADIFDGPNEHTAANASFSVVLIYREPRLPPRTISLFDGLQEVLGSTVALDLSGFIVSPVPSGSLTLYAQEGDCNPGPESCADGNNESGLERVRVIAPDPARSLILSDPLNPPNDIFNRTINTVDPPLQDVPGTDIDRFDISSVLRGGDDRLTVEITTPLPHGGASGELIGLVYVVVGIDVFAPELHVDSKIEVATERGEVFDSYFPQDLLRVEYSISNTGNLPGTGVEFVADLPELVQQFVVLEEPEGTTVTIEPTGGFAGHGRVRVQDLAVRHGEVSDLVLLLQTDCPLDQAQNLVLTASVAEAVEGSVPFTMTTTATMIATQQCGPRYLLLGGGGCRHMAHSPLRSTPQSKAGWLFALLGGLWLVRRRHRRSLLLLLVGLGLTSTACSGDPTRLGPDRDPPLPRGEVCPGRPDMVLIPSIRNNSAFCVDPYEASVQGNLGNQEQPVGGDGSTDAIAEAIRFGVPVGGVSWFQARAACINAGKRLCSAREWLLACRGASDRTFPYGDDYEPGTCNGFDATRGGITEAGALIRPESDDQGPPKAGGCVSENGVYDLSGNLWEWNNDRFLEGSRRGLAGGSFRSNRAGLSCVTEGRHEEPEMALETYGFRCCANPDEN